MWWDLTCTSFFFSSSDGRTASEIHYAYYFTILDEGRDCLSFCLRCSKSNNPTGNVIKRCLMQKIPLLFKIFPLDLKKCVLSFVISRCWWISKYIRAVGVSLELLYTPQTVKPLSETLRPSCCSPLALRFLQRVKTCMLYSELLSVRMGFVSGWTSCLVSACSYQVYKWHTVNKNSDKTQAKHQLVYMFDCVLWQWAVCVCIWQCSNAAGAAGQGPP